MITDTAPLTRDMCDASASLSEFAANVVILPSGNILMLCQHHTNKHADSFPEGTTVVPIVSASTDEEPAPAPAYAGESGF